MVADNSFVASSTFEPAPRKRHERRSSTSQIGRGGWAPQYAHITPTHQSNQARCNLQQHDTEIHLVPAGELNSSNTKSSAFGVYKEGRRGDSNIKRHQRSASCSLVGRGGAQCTGAYAKFGKEHSTREERLRHEVLRALAKRDLEAMHNIYTREHTKLPFENIEIRKWRLEVRNYISQKLKDAKDQKELKEAIALADKQVTKFPYAKEVKESKAYQDAVGRLAQAPEAPEAPAKMKKTVSINHMQEVKMFSPEVKEESPQRTTFGDDNDTGSMLGEDSDEEQY